MAGDAIGTIVALDLRTGQRVGGYKVLHIAVAAAADVVVVYSPSLTLRASVGFQWVVPQPKHASDFAPHDGLRVRQACSRV